MLRTLCPCCFSKKDKDGGKDSDSNDSDEEEQGLMKNEDTSHSAEQNPCSDDSVASAPKAAPKAPPPKGGKAPPAPAPAGAKTDPANAPTAEELVSDYTDEIQQLAHIIALMIAECVFAYEEPFEIQLESQFAMMFDMELSFSFNSLKEAERQLMSALAEIFSKKDSAAFFFNTLDGQMNEYVSGLSATEKFEYKQKSGYGRPDKLRLALAGEYAPKQEREDSYMMCVEFWDNTRRTNNPFRYFVRIYQAGSVTGESQDVKMMKAKKQ